MAGFERDAWFFALVDLFIGGARYGGRPEGLLAAAASDGERCEANFYIGEWHLLAGRHAEAKAFLETPAATCPKAFVEYSAAVAELARLTATPK